MSQHDFVADMLLPQTRDPMEKRVITLHVYPTAAPNHHGAGAIFVKYGEDGSGTWTTLLGLARSLIVAEERQHEGKE